MKFSLEIEVSTQLTEDSFIVRIGAAEEIVAQIKAIDTGNVIGYEWQGRYYQTVDGLVEVIVAHYFKVAKRQIFKTTT